VSDARFLPHARPLPEQGEMEKTMFAAFTAKSIMQGTIQRLSGLDGWKDSIAIRERSFGAKKGGTYMSWMRTSNRDESHIDETSKAPKATSSRLKPLDDVVRAAMKKCESDLQCELGNFHCPDEVNFQDRVTIRDHEFTSYRTSESHGVVFFRDTVGVDSLVPGKVRVIFLVTQGSAEHVFPAVHHYLTPPTSLPNPFARYPDFGASLWSSDTQKEITIVPGNRDIYHAIYRD
jgi:hypothetical protein